jgi:hypothetical protein
VLRRRANGESVEDIQPDPIIPVGKHKGGNPVPGNSKAIRAFRIQATRHWHRALRRRSQRTRLNWERMDRLASRWLPQATVVHPWPSVRFDART